MCAAFLLTGCKEPAGLSPPQETTSTDNAQRPSPTLSYDDRQMMRRYLVQGVYDGIAAIVVMQARIDSDHDGLFLLRQDYAPSTAKAKNRSSPMAMYSPQLSIVSITASSAVWVLPKL